MDMLVALAIFNTCLGLDNISLNTAQRAQATRIEQKLDQLLAGLPEREAMNNAVQSIRQDSKHCTHEPGNDA